MLTEDKVNTAFWVFICNIIQKLAVFVSIPFYTRILTEKQYGVYTTFQSLQAILIIFVSLNLFNSTYIAGLTKNETKRIEYTRSLIMLIAVISGLVSVVVLFVGLKHNNIFMLPTKYMYCMIVQMFGTALLNMNLAYERYNYHVKALFLYSIVYSFSLLITGAIATVSVEQCNRLDARIYSETIVYMMTVFVILLKFKAFNINSDALVYWKDALVTNIPLIPHYLSASILAKADQLMINDYCGEEATAYYGLIYQVSMVVTLVSNAIKSTFEPEIYGAIKTKKSINKKTSLLIKLVALFCFCTMLVIPEIIVIIAPSNYYVAIDVAAPVIGAVYFIYSYNIFSSVQFYYKKSVATTIISVIVAIINVLLNIIFIPKLGFVAAGYTTLVCYILFSILHLFMSERICGDKFGEKIFDKKEWLIISIVLVVAIVMIKKLRFFAIIRYLIMGIICLVAFFKRRLIYEILNS